MHDQATHIATYTATRAIRGEHESLAAVLRGLLFFARSISRGGVAPDAALCRAMLGYIGDFSDRVHHPTEDAVLFERLRARTGDADALIAELRTSQVQAAGLLRQLDDALARFELGGAKAAPPLCSLIERYALLSFRRMNRVQDEVIPTAEKMFAADDWAAVATAFAAHRDPLSGAHERAGPDELFARLAGVAPAAPASAATTVAGGYVARVWRGEVAPPPITTMLGGKIRNIDIAAGVLDSDYLGVPAFFNPAGHIQGGVLGAMLDDALGFLATATLEGGETCTTLSLLVSFLRPASAGPLLARARIVRRGGTIVNVAGELFQEDKLVATAVATLMIVRRA